MPIAPHVYTDIRSFKKKNQDHNSCAARFFSVKARGFSWRWCNLTQEGAGVQELGTWKFTYNGSKAWNTAKSQDDLCHRQGFWWFSLDSSTVSTKLKQSQKTLKTPCGVLDYLDFFLFLLTFATEPQAVLRCRTRAVELVRTELETTTWNDCS